MAKKAAKRKIARKEYTASDIKLLKMHSKARTPVSKLALQLLSLWTSESMGNHDSNVMGGANSVD